MADRPILLLGPQRLQPTVADAVASVDATLGDSARDARIALVTAGWEEREEEDAELKSHLDGRGVNLQLFSRVEDVFERDQELLDAMAERHRIRRRLQDLYRVRLSYALDAARDLLRGTESDDLLDDERVAAIEAVRELDRHHLERVRDVNREFEERWKPLERDAVRTHLTELERLLADASMVCVAGGHVAILLNRMRVFDFPSLVGDRPIVAWSAGAMALSRRIVLFHDSPPQGQGDAEVLDAGFDCAPGIVPLPHAKRRLLVDDEVRVGLFAQRFGPDLCTALDEGDRAAWDGHRWTGTGARRLTTDGRLEELDPMEGTGEGADAREDRS